MFHRPVVGRHVAAGGRGSGMDTDGAGGGGQCQTERHLNAKSQEGAGATPNQTPNKCQTSGYSCPGRVHRIAKKARNQTPKKRQKNAKKNAKKMPKKCQNARAFTKKRGNAELGSRCLDLAFFWRFFGASLAFIWRLVWSFFGVCFGIFLESKLAFLIVLAPNVESRLAFLECLCAQIGIPPHGDV